MVNWLGEICQYNIYPFDTVLDLGCGIMQATDDIKCKSVLGVDIWAIYLDKIKSLHPTVMISMDETYRFMDNSYDVVICLDVVEHLEYNLALKVLDECKRICRKTVIIYTPIEFDNNDQPEGGAWEMGDNEYQKHLCVINKSDLTSRDYFVSEMNGGYLGIYEK